MASYNLEDAAQLWYMQVQHDEGMPSWRRFTELLNLRYGPPLRSAPLAELAECRRAGMVEEYQDRFQALLPRAGHLDEAQRVQLFTGGLQPPLSIDVRIQNPQTLATAMSLARQFELCELYVPQAPKPVPRGLLLAPPPRLALPAPPGAKAPPPALITVEGRPIKRLSQAEHEERRRLGLCYNCDEKFTRGHNRVCKRLFLLEGVEEEDDAEDAATEDAPVFSLQAIAGVTFSDTMQITVTLGPASLVALLDSGSTHNFISKVAVHRSGLPLQRRPRLTAMVANGERVNCLGVIRNAPLSVGGDTFPGDLFVMPLAAYDVVLGTKWLPHWAPSSGTSATAQSPSNTRAAASHHPGAGGATGAVRPYRYPVLHKDELEHQCAAMMAQGLIRRSSSAFSSPVLLVKKADGSWRFCVDYRALNAITVKDAFPIPVVNELLDELHGARFFTKLDLRSGYHQVRMKSKDVAKTAFRTHDGLYEFLVMPFGLCNAPATFQALMNDVLRAYLRRFVLVFFDDILIYSTSWANHLRHLRVVLDTLHGHCLFVKRSKCSFGVDSVSYLGHIISAAGVAMDLGKVQAIHD
ncbi:uncharacterized protein [Miscanthus floridulus]|uniref:uncharacterized protein n=1 Tax=Miscanthus floridulus TaxID=154761 RepID=UPI0034590F1F